MSQLSFYRILALLAFLSAAGFVAVYFFTGRYLLAAAACFIGFLRFFFGSLRIAKEPKT